jgi:hippurate hydrolase
VLTPDELAEIIAIRRDLHAHPELAFEESRTAERIVQALSNWGVEVHRGLGKTGVVGVVRSGKSPRAIGLRADIDGLPITEENSFAHASANPGRMHACGHDGHIAMLLAAAKAFSKRHEFDGTVYLIFQPAEEGGKDGGGARAMIQDGLFERFPMEAVFGIHNWPGLKAGQFAIRSGPIFGSDSRFRIAIRGRGTHACFPHEGIDPLPVAWQMTQAFQTILTRNKRPIDPGLISVTMMHAGESYNVVPSSCEIQGTVRAFTLEVLDLIERRMRQIAEATCAAYEARCEFEFQRSYPPTINHTKETEFVHRVLKSLVGEPNVLEFEPTTGAEDFSYYLLKRPGCYFVMGNGNGEHRTAGHASGSCVLHSGSYDFNDELIGLGAATWLRLVEEWFST